MFALGRPIELQMRMWYPAGAFSTSTASSPKNGDGGNDEFTAPAYGACVEARAAKLGEIQVAMASATPRLW